jgi:hypothetical protein
MPELREREGIEVQKARGLGVAPASFAFHGPVSVPEVR